MKLNPLVVVYLIPRRRTIESIPDESWSKFVPLGLRYVNIIRIIGICNRSIPFEVTRENCCFSNLYGPIEN